MAGDVSEGAWRAWRAFGALEALGAWELRSSRSFVHCVFRSLRRTLYSIPCSVYYVTTESQNHRITESQNHRITESRCLQQPAHNVLPHGVVRGRPSGMNSELCTLCFVLCISYSELCILYSILYNTHHTVRHNEQHDGTGKHGVRFACREVDSRKMEDGKFLGTI